MGHQVTNIPLNFDNLSVLIINFRRKIAKVQEIIIIIFLINMSIKQLNFDAVRSNVGIIFFYICLFYKL